MHLFTFRFVVNARNHCIACNLILDRTNTQTLALVCVIENVFFFFFFFRVCHHKTHLFEIEKRTKLFFIHSNCAMHSTDDRVNFKTHSSIVNVFEIVLILQFLLFYRVTNAKQMNEKKR